MLKSSGESKSLAIPSRRLAGNDKVSGFNCPYFNSVPNITANIYHLYLKVDDERIKKLHRRLRIDC